MVALVLAGHGSQVSPNTAGLVWRYVDRLRELGVADEVAATFWKEQPSLADVLHTLVSDLVIVVPVFTAQGFYTRTVIPTEMGLMGDSTRTGERTIRYAKTLGEHPRVAQIVRQRVDDAIAQYNLDAATTTVAVIGHGTPRSKRSQDATCEQVALLEGTTAQIIPAFLDDDPNIPSIFERAEHDQIIAVPFFLAPGSHVTIDVPEALGLAEGETALTRDDVWLTYTPPVGTDDAMVGLILELAHDAGLPHIELNGDEWGGYPRAGWDDLIAATVGGVVRFGALSVSWGCVQPVDVVQPLHQFETPGTLRDHLRENPFRPLASAADIPHDWSLSVGSAEHMCAVVETVYPGAIADWAAHHRGGFRPVRLRETVGRQQTNLRQLEDLTYPAIDHHVTSVCGRCSKHPRWHSDDTPTHKLPCREACNLWMSTLLDS